jgi:pimeloyl-ACP methyl ester carboxylesterase
MPILHSNGIQIAYDTFGDPLAPALLLIMGFSGQMILWEEPFCDQLARRGFFVIRFDNRDVGLSSKIESPTGDSPYTLSDMARDSVGLMDGLGVDRAHICGTSMGGMIAQILAIQFPERVLSLISISSTTGNPGLVPPDATTGDSSAESAGPAPRDRQANIEYTINGLRDLSGPGFPFDEEYARQVAARLYDRAFYPEGAERQLLAIMSSGNRRPPLEKLSVPTLVIHGDADPLVPVTGGRDTAEAIQGADLLVIERMGHDMPRQVWTQIIDAIASHAKKAAAPTGE